MAQRVAADPGLLSDGRLRLPSSIEHNPWARERAMAVLGAPATPLAGRLGFAGALPESHRLPGRDERQRERVL